MTLTVRTSESLIKSAGGRTAMRRAFFKSHEAYSIGLILALLHLSLIASVAMADTSSAGNPAVSAPKPKRKKHQDLLTGKPILFEHSDPLAAEMSPEAVQMADLLGIREKLRRLVELNKAAATVANGSLAHAMREERSDLRFEVLATVEESRLQIDCVQAEIAEELVILEEARRIIFEEAQKRVNRANLAAFRTNGVLWAVAEALDIPTYIHPRLSISSGSIGILAGIVPSVFSAYATRTSSGGHYKRQIYPNILTKIFDLPTIPRVEYPGVVWQYLNSNPIGETRTRREIMQDRWREDSYIHFFKDGLNKQQILLLTGNEPYTGDSELISDKVIMMGQLKAVTLQMTRPLLEICMVVQGKKHFAAADAPAAPVSESP